MAQSLRCSRVTCVDLTHSYRDALPQSVRDRYDFMEVRNAATILAATNPDAFNEVIEVLDWFALDTSDLLTPGGQESALAARLNQRFRSQGWREARVDTLIRLQLKKLPYRPAGETAPVVVDTETANEGYLVDNFKARVALDVEWNAKDGNLDRDIAAYRALYDAGLIDGAVMITRTQTDLRQLARRLASDAGWTVEAGKKILGTTTTTNSEKLRPRMGRGDSAGCPLLAVLISARTWRRPRRTP